MEKTKVPKPIKKLDETVINRIAAGEIIQRPSNALKELMENSLDAGSTNIQITIKDGGFKLLQILDNGHGIRLEDMKIVCERFTTSKLKNFEDLSNISTFGFRGEALASISHVAHVTITTKTFDSDCAYRACYSDGKLVSSKPGANPEPKPCAGNIGTQITVEDLFYNVPMRKKALKNSSEEYNRILDVVNRYAIHKSGISFTCRKQGSNQADLSTLLSSTTLDNIRQIYGGTASELLEISKKFRNLEFKINGYISNANYNLKKMVFLLFINDRAVENSSLKKIIENVYTTLLPKNTHPFVYLSLKINPQNVDVNVHPTKREVRFLNEDEVIASIGDAMQERLAGANSSRVFLTQTLLPGSKPVDIDANESENVSKVKSSREGPNVIRGNKLVRTDSRVQTLDNFCSSNGISNENRGKIIENISVLCNDSTDNSDQNLNESTNEGLLNLKKRRERIEVRLQSILTLRERLKEVEHKGLTELLSNHTMVGCVDDSLSFVLIQHQLKLYMVNYNVIGEELFYQLTLQEFHNFGFIHLSSPAPIYELVLYALENANTTEEAPDDSLKSNEEISQIIVDLLVSRKQMLLEYFSMTIDDQGQLTTLPLMINGYSPNLNKLPIFLLRLGTEKNEEEIITTKSDNEKQESQVNRVGQKQKASFLKFRWQIENLIFPTLKGEQFIAPKSIIENGHVIQIANLPDLYHIFERC
ncbi:8270_t:CDS:10 [Entrophospora sp. SA101]|nr:11949_t:CDS:10 [Entrophospora sp. SA101]CAJ0638893.1 8270_t:CDS:10 [Entrophospora sp. SA101]CAJ0822971.1 10354_t:CDS:10 [Entrophospora sp. SA101]CAJ0851255.1 259_t:CDS:10 [Entrophospora sp. SA101]